MAERALEVEEVTANVVKYDQTVKERKEESRAWGLTYKGNHFLMWRNIMKKVIMIINCCKKKKKGKNAAKTNCL